MFDQYSFKRCKRAVVRPIYRLWLASLLFVSATSSANFLQGLSEPQFLPVEQAFRLVDQQIKLHPKQGEVLAVSWQIEPGYYLYQHRFSAQPQASTTASSQPLKPIQYSQQGIAKFDEAFGDIIAFYDQITVSFPLPESTIVHINYQGCADAGLCYPPQTKTIDISTELAAVNASTVTAPSPTPEASTPKTPTQAVAIPKTTDGSTWFNRDAPWLTLGLFLLMGLGLTFTPCVLPMVPILSSLVIGQNTISARRGLILSLSYVIGMATTYAIAGTIMGLFGASANLQSAMQAPAVLITFAIIFVALALSMFGVYELSLPKSLQSRLSQVQQRQQGGSLIGVGLMGILSALVVSPCISAPLAGALVYLSTTGDALLGGSALFALGLGMGIPLIIIATTGVRVLPKSGPWMEQVKILFGVLLILVAIWLLQRLLSDAVFLLSVGIVILLYGVALGALHRQPQNLSWYQRLPRGIALLLVIYGACAVIGGLQGNSSLSQPLAKTAPNQIETTTDLFYKTADTDELRRLIEQSNTPVMIDIYADWCISCKVMEREVFAHPQTIAAGKQFRWLKLDMTANNASHIEFLQDHQVFGPPAVLFYRQGKEITEARLIGEVTQSDFVKHLGQLSQ